MEILKLLYNGITQNLKLKEIKIHSIKVGVNIFKHFNFN